MNYHLILTRQCNLNCTYCHGGEETENTEIQYSLDELARFLEKDRTLTTLLFYGGEPTLRIDLMKAMMDRFPDARFMLQTNALCIPQIPIKYILKFHSILVSIDGREEITDGYRSKGVYNRVLDSVRWLRDVGFVGDIVARMAVSQKTDIYQDVLHLLEHTNPIFDHVHWQLNVVWDADDNWTDFDGWVSSSYLSGIERLIDYWAERIQKGELPGIVPFMPLMYTLLTGEESELRCGSGLDTFAIHVNGKIGVCPISPDWSFSIVGDIRETEPAELENIMYVDEPCPSCEVYGICGGRCLFANKERLWGQEGFEKICEITKHLISNLERVSSIIADSVSKGMISLDDLRYPEFNNGCEIIP